MKKIFSHYNLKFVLSTFAVLMLLATNLLSVSSVYAFPMGGGTGDSNSDSSSASVNCGNFNQAGPLCLPNNPFNGSTNSLVGQTTATGLIGLIIKLMLYFAGIIAVVFIIIGGYYYLTARGNEEQATKGRQTLIYALIGLSIVILSYVIVSALTKQLTANI